MKDSTSLSLIPYPLDGARGNAGPVQLVTVRLDNMVPWMRPTSRSWVRSNSLRVFKKECLPFTLM